MDDERKRRKMGYPSNRVLESVERLVSRLADPRVMDVHLKKQGEWNELR